MGLAFGKGCVRRHHAAGERDIVGAESNMPKRLEGGKGGMLQCIDTCRVMSGISLASD